MQPDWIDPGQVRLEVEAQTLGEVLATCGEVMAPRAGASPEKIRIALDEYASAGSIAAGNGVAIPHAAFPGLAHPLVGLVRTRAGLEVPGRPDDRGVDLFFVVLAPPAARTEHLQILAHIARLALQPGALERLRGIGDPAEVATLVATGADPESNRTPAPTIPSAGRELLIMEIEGESTVDRLLVELSDQRFDDAVVVECQTLRDALSRELPLFAGFRELFGDPGGRRLVLLTLPSEHTELAVRLLRRTCRETGARAGRVLALPLARAWDWHPSGADPDSEH